mmetsp:Transcript_28621/g.67227  ORF Transcript_28621/g.67227 Transcript_28621/m.67227 type:complete len:488 (-) Transcript_28621:200-1663(-)
MTNQNSSKTHRNVSNRGRSSIFRISRSLVFISPENVPNSAIQGISYGVHQCRQTHRYEIQLSRLIDRAFHQQFQILLPTNIVIVSARVRVAKQVLEDGIVQEQPLHHRILAFPEHVAKVPQLRPSKEIHVVGHLPGPVFEPREVPLFACSQQTVCLPDPGLEQVHAPACRRLQIRKQMPPHGMSHVVVGSPSLLSVVTLFEITARNKSHDEHDPIFLSRLIKVTGPTVPHVLVEHHRVTLLENANVETRLTIARSLKRVAVANGIFFLKVVVQKVALTEFVQILVGTPVGSGANGGSAHSAGRVLEGYKHGIGMQKGPCVQYTGSEPVAVGVDSLGLGVVHGGKRRNLHNGRVRSEGCLERSFQLGVGTHLGNRPGNNRTVLRTKPQAQSAPVVTVPKELVPGKIQIVGMVFVVPGFQIGSQFRRRLVAQNVLHDGGSVRHDDILAFLQRHSGIYQQIIRVVCADIAMITAPVIIGHLIVPGIEGSQ